MTRWPNSECLTSGCHCTPVHPSLVGRESSDGGGRAGREDGEPVRRFRHRVAVAHPRRSGHRAGPPSRVVAGGDVTSVEPYSRAPVSKPRRRAAAPYLEPVADAEHGNAELEDAGIERRRPRLVHARRTTAQDDARGMLRGDLGGRDRVRHDLAVHAGLAHAASDQLRVLRAEVDDEHGGLRCLRSRRTPSSTGNASTSAIAPRHRAERGARRRTRAPG